MADLSSLSPRPGSKRKKMRLGKGDGSGKGRSCTKGQKGQTSRSGNTRKESGEGGQMPLLRRIPKSGFSNVKFAKKTEYVNLNSLAKFKDEEITPQFLKEKRLVKHGKHIKILGNGEIKSSLKISAHAFSKSAQEKIKTAGGTAAIIKNEKKVKNEVR
jgi:large subunit ribosomal protein L15